MDENYEWDSEFSGDMELLETLHLGLAGPRPLPEAEPELGVRALQRGLAVPHRPSLFPVGPHAPGLLLLFPWLVCTGRACGASWRQ